MNKEGSQENLLSNGSDVELKENRPNRHPQPSQRRTTPERSTILAVGIIICFFLSNVILLYQNNHLQHSLATSHSIYSGLSYDTLVTYQSHTDYGSTNETLSDPLWETIDNSPVVVALSDKYARDKGLELSARFPWDDTKGIYHIKAFHHLHCLKNFRKAYTDLLRGNPPVISPAHFYHCLDTLRQDFMCLADDTPMPTVNALHHVGNGQVRQCRNWEGLVEWTRKPEQNACFRMIDEYEEIPNSLEEFAFCNEGSQYRPVADGYFEKFGHKDPYGN